ncbi:LysR family transcriptional regulator [Leptolyngbya sp. FACHB-36]|uniref:LysR family transcriptional regulator n=1 Tax=Leptolyngbya sp. FACHB-36 TaxID=2692808 RepID=UPI0016806F28|nr:LysR family transcriptional regulator [Leptolyngbya sp. FACHB-36]MBD2020890.1 LysR family transcriptional regulator [Leptolyngbya sp. FACHB-36]
MELRHLHYFIAVAEELNFSRAADRLHMAQPPLSQQIRQLEQELGFQVFHRTKRRVQLTEAGQAFLVEARQVLQHLDQAVQTGRQASRGEVGQLAIGFVSSTAYNILPPILQSFRRQVPDVTLELRELTTREQLQALLEGKLDIGFVRPPVEEPELATAVIFREPLMVALPEFHALQKRAKVPVRSLSNEPFILFPRAIAPGLYDPIISLCLQAGFSPRVVQEAIQMQTIVSLVAAEMGVAIVPLSLRNLQRQGVIYKPLQESTPMVEIVMIWRKTPTPIVQRFLAVTNDVCASI